LEWWDSRTHVRDKLLTYRAFHVATVPFFCRQSGCNRSTAALRRRQVHSNRAATIPSCRMQRESSIHASGGGEAGLLSAILRSLATVAMCSQCCALRIRLEARILSEVSTGDSGAKEFPRWRFLKLRFLYKHEARASESH